MSRKLRTAVGVVLSLLLLWWALRDVSAAEVARQLRDADFLLLTLSVLVALAGFHFRAFRWGILLSPVQPQLPFSPRLAATYIGFAANNVLPARVGEFARAFALSRLTGIAPAAAFATLVIERLFDGLVLVALLFIAMAAPGFPAAPGIAGGATVAAVAAAGASIALGFAVARPRWAARLVYLLTRLLPKPLRQPFVDTMRSFASGLVVLRDTRLFLASLSLTVAQWVFLALSFLLAFRAFDISVVPFSGAVFLQSVIALAVAVPSSPGFFGPFEVGARLGLSLWSVPADQAISFAIGFHIAGFLPVTLIGVYYVWRLNLRWSEVKESEETVESEITEGTTDGALNPGSPS